jgi:hypothetical protein
MKTTNTTNKKQVRFSNRSRMSLVDNLSLSPEASNLWYSAEESDIFKAWLSHQVHKVRSQLEEHSALLDEGLVTIDAAAILGLEKHLSSDLTAEYKNRRRALQRAVLEEHRWQRAVQVSNPARLAMISAQNSRWARERARAAALLLEQDVMQDFEEMKLSATMPRRCSMPHLNNEADTTEEKHSYKRPAFQRRWSISATMAKRHCSISSV